MPDCCPEKKSSVQAGIISRPGDTHLVGACFPAVQILSANNTRTDRPAETEDFLPARPGKSRTCGHHLRTLLAATDQTRALGAGRRKMRPVPRPVQQGTGE